MMSSMDLELDLNLDSDSDPDQGLGSDPMAEQLSDPSSVSIPSKRYFTIGEVSELCDVKPHVLRYWEQEFPSLKPVKRRGNRRYYQRQDIILVRQIRSLLHDQGYTISGARQRLSDAGEQNPAVVDRALVKDMLAELKSLQQLLESH